MGETRKERLALANISGSMMIQTTVPSALGILFTRLDYFNTRQPQLTIDSVIRYVFESK